MNALALRYTGERVIPDRFSLGDRILQEHLARYRFAARKIKEYLTQRRAAYDGLKYEIPGVIDAPCGSGYGSALIAEQCGERQVHVLGIDIDIDTVLYAEARYGQVQGFCTFIQADLDGSSPIYYSKSVATVCFEGIEHVDDQQLVAKRLCDWTEKNGLVIVSTPRVHGPGAGSEYHTTELTLQEFRGLFEPHLREIEMFGQELNVGDCESDENARFYVLVGRK